MQLRRVARARTRVTRAHDELDSETRAALAAGCSVRSIARASGETFETVRRRVNRLKGEAS